MDIEKQKRALEQTIVDEKEKVKKWEARLTEQRSTREYAALAREIDIAKKSNLTMAEELIELGKQLKLAQDAVKAKETEFQGRTGQLSTKSADVKVKLGDVDVQQKALEEKRDEAAKLVDSNLLRKYEGVRKKRLPVLVSVAQGGTCMGCNMNVPPQLYNNLRSTLGTDICPSCNRIIYAAEALEERATK
jgi:predicted  nucleic acid-binding Zn-ribbon protein